MRVDDIMTPDPVTVAPDTSFKQVVELLIEHGVGGLPVVGADGRLVGIVTETDLVSKPAYGDDRRGIVAALRAGKHRAWHRKAAGLNAGELMTRQVLTAEPFEDLHVAARRLMDNRIGRLPVVEGEQLVGIISRRDLLRPFDRTDADIAQDVEQLLANADLFESGHAVRHAVRQGVVELSGTVPFPHHQSMLEDAVRGLPGVVGLRSSVSAELPEPEHGPPPRSLPPVPGGDVSRLA